MILSAEWSTAYPGACVGVVRISGVRNPDGDPALDAVLDETAGLLRDRWAGASRTDLLARPELASYAAYYRRFEKTYHVLLQLESVALKGKPLRAGGAIVAAMFRAELETGLLTAGHDAAHLIGELAVGLVHDGDTYVGLGGRDIAAAPGDMCIRDDVGIVSSIVYGPDDRTRLRGSTTVATFTTYAPSGIGRGAMAHHHEILCAGIRTFAPDSVVESVEVYPQD